MANWQNKIAKNVNCQSNKLTKQKVDKIESWKMASWQNVKLIKQVVVEITNGQNGKLMKKQADKMSSWQNAKLIKQVSKTECWWNWKFKNGRLTKCWVDETDSWWNLKLTNGKLMKKHVDKMSNWHNKELTKQIVKCVDELAQVDKIAGWQNSRLTK